MQPIGGAMHPVDVASQLVPIPDLIRPRYRSGNNPLLLESQKVVSKLRSHELSERGVGGGRALCAERAVLGEAGPHVLRFQSLQGIAAHVAVGALGFDLVALPFHFSNLMYDISVQNADSLHIEAVSCSFELAAYMCHDVVVDPRQKGLTAVLRRLKGIYLMSAKSGLVQAQGAQSCQLGSGVTNVGRKTIDVTGEGFLRDAVRATHRSGGLQFEQQASQHQAAFVGCVEVPAGQTVPTGHRGRSPDAERGDALRGDRQVERHALYIMNHQKWWN